MNRGYQNDDKVYIDYGLWRLPGTNLDVRGSSDLNRGIYFSSIGAAQTFGRFCIETYTSLISKWTYTDGLNLGFSGAGPSFFFQRHELMKYVNGGRFCIVQVMSGRSIANSYFELGSNQGTVRRRDTQDSFVFAENAYAKFLRESSQEEAIALREEIKRSYIAEYKKLAEEIKVPTILLYFSTRRPGIISGLGNVGKFWGDFPHFVDEEVINEIRPFFSHYVECVSKRGLPQTITNQSTGEPHLLWDAARFPTIKHRHHNLYYPSPQMQLDAALALLDVVKTVQATTTDTRDEVMPKMPAPIKSKTTVSLARPSLTFPNPVANFVSSIYQRSHCILEYGSGGSTVLASEQRAKKIYSIESDIEWAKNLRQYLQDAPTTVSMPEIIYSDIGQTREWGYPKDSSSYAKFPQYAFSIWLRQDLTPPEVVLIDGRFRVACFLSTALMIEKPTKVLFDDYSDRPKYHWVERYAKPSEVVDRMAVFDLTPGLIGKRDFLNLMQFSLDPS